MNAPEAIAALAFFGMIAAVATPLARAFAQRIGGRSGDTDTQALRDEVTDLRAELDNMRGRMAQLDELQERLDFTERALTQVMARDALPGPK